MASKSQVSIIALLISLNILFFTMVSSHQSACPSERSFFLFTCSGHIWFEREIHTSIRELIPSCCPLIENLSDKDAVNCLCSIDSTDDGLREKTFQACGRNPDNIDFTCPNY
ncbi:Hydrophobic seed protein [Trema orientale]|uniref:Hydrophobic seed protein n=1 Tax=Trema orientale TaxID=63057 RepID=A0A2P5E9Q4_TREOI|nr:Hydrophobic seed protein [Trema orientale]